MKNFVKLQQGNKTAGLLLIFQCYRSLHSELRSFSLVSHPNILKVHHNDCPFQRQLRQRGAQVVALAAAAAATAVSNAAECRLSPRHRRCALWAMISKILFRNISIAEEEISTNKWVNLKWVLIYHNFRSNYSLLNLYFLKIPYSFRILCNENLNT